MRTIITTTLIAGLVGAGGGYGATRWIAPPVARCTVQVHDGLAEKMGAGDAKIKRGFAEMILANPDATPEQKAQAQAILNVGR